MKKLMKFASMAMIGLFVFIPMINVEALTEWTVQDWVIDGGDGKGSATAVTDNITNIKGDDQIVDGMAYGPYSTKSTAKLADGITEEIYIELNKDDMTHAEYFDITMSLNNESNEYATEAPVRTQKDGDNYYITAGWANDFKAEITEDGVYTYRYNATLEDGKTYFEFVVLNGDEEIASTGKVSMGETNAVSVRRIWFCNVQVANGVNVYTALPSEVTEPEIPVTPVEPETPTEEVKEDVQNPETSDGIMLFLGLTVIGFAGVALTYRRLHN